MGMKQHSLIPSGKSSASKRTFMGIRDAGVMLRVLRARGLDARRTPEKVIEMPGVYVAEVFDRTTKEPRGKRWLWLEGTHWVTGKTPPRQEGSAE
jgi:hypothetical protein